MELVAPIGAWGEFDEVVVTVRKGSALLVARRGEEYVERPIPLSELPDKVFLVIDAYSELIRAIADALGTTINLAQLGREDLGTWLESYGAALNKLSSVWGKEVDKVGPFKVDKELDTVYVPFMGASATATYVLQPFRNAVIRAENKGRSMALGSVEVVWQGSTVVKVGIRTVAGAALLSQGEPSLHNSLPRIKLAVEHLANRLREIVSNS